MLNIKEVLVMFFLIILFGYIFIEAMAFIFQMSWQMIALMYELASVPLVCLIVSILGVWLPAWLHERKTQRDIDLQDEVRLNNIARYRQDRLMQVKRIDTWA